MRGRTRARIHLAPDDSCTRPFYVEGSPEAKERLLFSRAAAHGPPLTPQEAVASVARRVRRLEAQGLDPDRAIVRAAVEAGVAPEKVRWCAETAFPGSPVRLSRSGRRRRGALALAAAL